MDLVHCHRAQDMGPCTMSSWFASSLSTFQVSLNSVYGSSSRIASRGPVPLAYSTHPPGAHPLSTDFHNARPYITTGAPLHDGDKSLTGKGVAAVKTLIKQESPPAWTQEAYRLPRIPGPGGGVSRPRSGGVPCPRSWGGYPISGPGGTPSQVQEGYPIPDLGGDPIPGQGVPRPRSGGYPIPGLAGGTPGTTPLTHQRWIWGSHKRESMQKGSTLALKPRADVTRSPKQGYLWPY